METKSEDVEQLLKELIESIMSAISFSSEDTLELIMDTFLILIKKSQQQTAQIILQFMPLLLQIWTKTISVPILSQTVLVRQIFRSIDERLFLQNMKMND